MLPSRGIVRSLPSVGVQRQAVSRHIPSRALLRNGRQFGTLRSGPSSTFAANSTPLTRSRQYVAPIALGGVSSMRALSLWGYGKQTTPEESTSAATATTTPETFIPDQAVGNAAAAAKEAAVEATDAASSAVEATAQSTELSSISDIVNAGSEILSRPESLGYLKSLGLDYGWGFTSIMQSVLEHVHVWSGLSWGGAIIATAFLMRAAMVYPQIRSTKFTMDMKRMQEDPRHVEVTTNIQKALREGDRVAQQQAQFLSNVLRKEYNVPMTGMIWAFIPIPFSIGLFRIITGMTTIPVPALETGGWFWFQDLTASDPYFILPGLATGIMLLSLKINAVNSTEQQKNMMKKMAYVLVPLMIIGTSFLSAAVNLMGVSLAIATTISVAILNNNSIRGALGIPPVVAPAKPAAPAPVLPGAGLEYQAPRQPESLREKVTSGLDDVKKGFTEQIDKMTGSYRGTEKDQAARKRKELLQQLEEKRADQERQHFEEKYKRKN